MADKIIEIENLTTKEYNGDYEYYHEEVKKLQEKQSVIQNSTAKLQDSIKLNKPSSTNDSFLEPKNANSKNTKKLELLEKSIEEKEEKIRSLEVMIEANSSDFARLKELFEEKEEASRELEKVYTEWIEHNQA